MVMKYVPIDWFYQLKDYKGGIIQEVPEELARYIDEYTERESKKLEELEKVTAIGVDSTYAIQNPDAYKDPSVLVETTTQEATAGELADEPTTTESLATKKGRTK